MSTVLFVTWWGGGNQNPFLALGARLVARGHRVRVLGPAGLVDRFDMFERAITDGWLPNALDVLTELEREPADVLVVDYMLPEALTGAEVAGVPTIALVHTLYRQMMSGGELMPMTAMGDVAAVNAAREQYALPAVPTMAALLDRVERVIVTTIAELDFVPGDIPERVTYVGPLIEAAGADEGWSPPWPASDRRPLVVVCLGTTPMDELPVMERVLGASRDLDARVFVTVGPHVDVAALDVPGNVVVRGFVQHAAVLPHAQLLVTHAGLGTVMTGLRFGTPLLCIPLGRDQPANASRVEAIGAGRAISPECAPDEIRAAVEAMLDGSDHRVAAEAVARTIDTVIRRDLAVDAVERSIS